MTDRYAQCDDTCTVDCGHCKGAGPPADVTREPTGGQELREAVARLVEAHQINATPNGEPFADRLDDLLRSLLADAERVRRVRELHQQIDYPSHHAGFCDGCEFTYPCPTIRALDGEPQP